MRRIYIIGSLFLMLAGLSGCGQQKTAQPEQITVVLEQGEGFDASSYVCTTEIGEDAVFTIDLKEGYELQQVDCGQSCEWETERDGRQIGIILPGNRYSRSIRLKMVQVGEKIAYYANGGTRLDGENPDQPVIQMTSASHLRRNASIGTDLFKREGYTLKGWNTLPDGSGTAVGLGSRISWSEGLALYGQWIKWADASAFQIEETGEGCKITGYTGSSEILAVPGEIDGKAVWTIGENAFADLEAEQVILPPGIRRVEKDAFRDSSLKELYMYDDITFFSDYAVTGADQFHTLHLNAILPPVYSKNYFATFADKFDCLLSIQNDSKIVLFSGSSTRFGYNSERIQKAFPEYQVVNMGVFAYTNAWPQFLLILDCMKEQDILIHSPEFDAAKRQFCTSDRVDDEFFAMCEANYDLAARLDLQKVGGTFSALTEYLSIRKGMAADQYATSPADFTEEGTPSEEPCYNLYGDYILYRPNAESEDPIYGLPVEYTRNAFPKEQFIEPLNQVFRLFLDKGVRVFFTYAPRNRKAISEDSTLEERAALDAYFREELVVPVLSDLEESLYSGIYLYGTDNHLSTEGAEIRTGRIIEELRTYLNTQ